MGSFSACSLKPSPPASLGLFHQCEDFSFPHQYVLHPASSSFDVYLAIISLPGIFKTGSILIERIFTRWSSSFPTPSTTTWSSPVWWGSSWAVYLHAHGSHPPKPAVCCIIIVKITVLSSMQPSSSWCQSLWNVRDYLSAWHFSILTPACYSRL